jgi:hypothetical protein
MRHELGLGRQQLHYLGDPDMAVVYIPDEAGKFIWRCLVRLVVWKGYFSLVHYRYYGNGPFKSIFSELSNHIPVFKALDIRLRKTSVYSTDTIWLESPTKLNNEVLYRPVWTDHPIRNKQGHMQIQCVDTPYSPSSTT